MIQSFIKINQVTLVFFIISVGQSSNNYYIYIVTRILLFFIQYIKYLKYIKYNKIKFTNIF